MYKLNHWYGRAFGFDLSFDRPAGTAQEASDKVYSLLTGNAPCMIARYGSTELLCLSNYLGIRQGPKNFFRFICGKADPWWWAPERVFNMRDYSGFFPVTEAHIERFCAMMLQDTAELDILASWLTREKNLDAQLQGKDRIFLPYLEPYYAEHPWTRALEGKKVVVVHPFDKPIEFQYREKRTQLFNNHDILPPFTLRTVKAVQSLGGKADGFDSWFDALQSMKDAIDAEDYDICLIGCGAYGFPLAAHVKRSGKKAVHMGGALQLLFGIKGNRWEDPEYGVREWGLPRNYYPELFNEAWIKVGKDFRPENANQVENACYW